MAMKGTDSASNTNKVSGASFRVRQTGRFRPNINEMKINAKDGALTLGTPIQTERASRDKGKISFPTSLEISPGKGSTMARGKLFKTGAVDQRPITEQASRMTGGVQTQRTAPDISSNEYFMPKKRIQQINNGS